MPGFQFELSQLVNVPGKDQQGRISGRTEYLIKPSIYQVTWLDAIGNTPSEMFSEAEMIEAQKPKADTTMTVKVDADTADVDAKIERTTASAKRLQETADAALDSLSRLPRNVLKLRPARRSAPKRKPRR